MGQYCYVPQNPDTPPPLYLAQNPCTGIGCTFVFPRVSYKSDPILSRLYSRDFVVPKTYHIYIAQFKVGIVDSTSSTEETNQRLCASWYLVGGRLQGDESARLSCKRTSPPSKPQFSALPTGNVSGFYSTHSLHYLQLSTDPHQPADDRVHP